MGRLQLDGDAPLDRNLFYDPNGFISEFLHLSFRSFRADRPTHIAIASGPGANGRQLILKSLQILPSILGRDVKSTWVLGRAENSAVEVASNILHNLSRLWLETLPIGGIPGESTFLDIPRSLRESEDRLRAVLLRLSSETIVIVSDVTAWSGRFDEAGPWTAFIDALADKLLTRNVLFVSVLRENSFDDVYERSPDLTVNPLEAALEGRMNDLLSSIDGRAGIGDVSFEEIHYDRILAPWYAYGGGLRPAGYSFLTEETPAPEETLDFLVGDQLIYPLIADGFALTRYGRDKGQLLYDVGQKRSELSADVLPNALKILSFVYPEKLSEINSDVTNLLEAEPDSRTLLQMLAALLSPGAKDEAWYAALYDFLETPKSYRMDNMLVRNKTYSAIALNYLAQSLLSGGASDAARQFKVFETLSYLYADTMLNERQSSVDDTLEAAGWVYNIGYVYDNCRGINPAIRITNFKKGTDAAALTALAKVTDADPRTMIEVEYQKGLSQYSIEDFLGSAESFTKALRICAERPDYVLERRNGFLIKAEDFAPSLFTNAFHSLSSTPRYADSALFNEIQSIDSTLVEAFGFSFVREFFGSDIGRKGTSSVSEMWNFTLDGKPIVGIVGHRAAIGDTCHLAAITSGDLGVPVKFFAPSTFDEAVEIERSADYTLLIAGGPKSRFGLGEFIAGLDPAITNFFQFVTRGPLGIPISVMDRDGRPRPPRIVLSTWSVGDAIRAYWRWRHSKEIVQVSDGSILAEILTHPVVASFTKNLSQKVGASLADALVRVSTDIATRFGGKPKPDGIPSLQKALKEARRSTEAASTASLEDILSNAFDGMSKLERRAVLASLTTSEWIRVISVLLENLRATTVDTNDLLSLLDVLLEVSSFSIARCKNEADRRQMIEFQTATREFGYALQQLRDRERVRAMPDYERLSALTTQIFTSATAFIELVDVSDHRRPA